MRSRKNRLSELRATCLRFSVDAFRSSAPCTDYRRKRTQSSLATLSRMTRIDPGALFERADRIREQIDKDPDDAILWAGLGQIFLLLGLPAEAIEPFDTATRLDPNYTEAFRDLGRAYLDSGNTSEAARMFAHAIALAEKRGDVQTGREIHGCLKRAEKRGDQKRSVGQ